MRVLVVDDNRLAAEATAGALALAGHVTGYALSAEAVLAAHQPGTWDLVVTDLALPGMDGWQLLARLHALEPALPVGVVTGWPLDAAEPSFRERGACFMLVKPVDPLELAREAERVGAMLRTSA